MLLPGFIDSHFHVLIGGNPNVLRIENGKTLAEIQRQVREFAMKRPELKWIEVEGWNYSAFPRGTLPSAKDLAGLTGGRPAFLVAYDYHTIWMNREALREFGITRATRKVTFAEHVEKDPNTAEPTGILTGFGSTGLSPDAEAELRKHLPSHTPEAIARNVQNNLAAAVRAGITTVVDPQSYLEDLDMYARLRREGKLPTRLQVALFHRRGTAQETLQQFEQARQKYNDDWLRVSAVKLYIDDVIEPHTAALLEPYADRPGTRGELDYPPDEFKEVVARLDRMKFQVFIHSIGDRGIRTALTRKGLDGKPKGGWVPAQTIDLETAIRAYTINGAFANFVEQNRGSITPGKYADLVMLSDDLFKIPAEKMKDTNIVWTMVGGKTVWSKQ